MSAPEALDPATARALLRQMLRIRRFEEQCAASYSAGAICGFLHLYIGEEAVAAGLCAVLREEDAVLATYREHGHALARGVPMRGIMAEMYGRQEGCSGGRGGSMHLFDVGRRFFGGNAIVAGALPLAVGFALADLLQSRPHVTVCVFGEGAMAEGEFHEAANLAALWGLPVLFECENNLYAMGTHLTRSESETDLVAKAHSYRLGAASVDGMDVAAVREAARAAVAHVRGGGGPYFLECRTYRFRAHSMCDPELYRDPDEVAMWRARDPIATFVARGNAAGWWNADDVTSLRTEADAEVADAVTHAEAGTWEPVATLTQDVYASPALGGRA